METEVHCPDCGKVIAPPGAGREHPALPLREVTGEDVHPSSADPPADFRSRSRSQAADRRPRHPLDERPALATAKRPATSAAPTSPARRASRTTSAATGARNAPPPTRGARTPRGGAALRRLQPRLPAAQAPVLPDRPRLRHLLQGTRERAGEARSSRPTPRSSHKSHEWGKLKWMALIAPGLIVIATIFQLMR